jgi:tetratricopeptide (TPR) repeat protein
MRHLRFLIITLLLIAPVSASFADSPVSNPEAEIIRGLELLNEGNQLTDTNAPGAIDRYRQAAAILDSTRQANNLNNANLNHAIGNAYLKSDELGHAILAYRRALALDPTNHIAAESLRNARTLVGSQTPPSRSHRALRWLVSWRGYIDRSTLWAAAAVSFLIGWIFITARISRPARFALPAASIFIFISTISFGAIGLDAWQMRTQSAGVILDVSVVARTGPSSRIFDEAFQTPLSAGVEFVAVDHRNEWIQIQLPSNALAWVPQDAIAMVAAETR